MEEKSLARIKCGASSRGRFTKNEQTTGRLLPLKRLLRRFFSSTSESGDCHAPGAGRQSMPVKRHSFYQHQRKIGSRAYHATAPVRRVKEIFRKLTWLLLVELAAESAGCAPRVVAVGSGLNERPTDTNQ